MKQLRDYLLIAAAAAIYGASVCFLMFPNDFSFGGSSGAGLILSRFLPFSASAITAALNLLLILLAFILLGRRFAVRTVVGSTVTTGFVYLFGLLPFADTLNTGWIPADLVLAGGLIAVGSALMFTVDSCSGGTDIVAMLISTRHPGVKIGRALLISDCAIILCTGLLMGWRAGVTSACGLVLKSLLIDAVMRPLQKRKAEREKAASENNC